MKSIFRAITYILIIMCFVSIFCTSRSVAYAAVSREVISYDSLDIYGDIIDYVYGDNIDSNLRVDRTAGSEGELSAAQYIADVFQGLGYEPYYENYIQPFTSTYSLASKIESVNAAAIKRASVDTAKFVIIGAHMDNTYGFVQGGSTTKSHGVYDNASGMVAMLNVARLIKDIDLDYNVLFVGFGAEELGSLGSTYFINHMTKDARDNMLLMINFDAIGAGEYMHIYCDEVATAHERLFRDVASAYCDKYDRETISSNPTFKKTNYTTNSGNIEYTHMGLSSDNGTFVGNGYNAVTFFSGNWNDLSKIGIVESSGVEVYHTSLDTLAYLDERYGETFYNRIENVINITMNTLTQEDFVDVLESDRGSHTYLFFTNSTWIAIICAVVVCLMVFLINMRNTKPTPVVTIDNDDELKQAVLNNDTDKILELQGGVGDIEPPKDLDNKIDSDK